VTKRLIDLRGFLRRHPSAVTVGGTLIVAGALAIAMIGKHDEFAAALHAAPIWILGIAVVLHICWLVARSEAWNVCVGAAGGRVGRRRLYRAASIGYLGNTFNGHFGMAVRIAALRRSAPADSPRASVLVAAEAPILMVEAALAALMSFTLIAPLGLPWWVPLIAFAGMVGGLALLQRVARHRREGFWRGLAVMREMKGRSSIIGLVLFAVLAQIARNWFLLQWTGVDASLLDSVALLIGVGVIGLLPVGPSLGAAAAVVILGTNGVAATAAAGAMLTVTAAVAALCFATWALVDRLWRPTAPEPAI
jgi:uncharacterized membrane protein YbhN (UPF0104 family)